MDEFNGTLLRCDWSQYREMAIEFLTYAPTLDVDELDSSFKCLTIGYMNLVCNKGEKVSAQAVLEIATHAYMLREVTLGVLE